MTGFIRRALRLPRVAGFTIVAALPLLAAPSAPRVATQTSLAVDAHDQSGRTRVSLAVAVTASDDATPTGNIEIRDNSQPLAGVPLNTQGRAALVLDLAAGEHSITASYSGDAAHTASVSEFKGVHALATSGADFAISVNPTSLSLTAGQSGSAIATITPENSSVLTSPMFVTLSCSGLPDQSSCTFTPENIEILPNATANITSSMVIQTQQQEGLLLRPGTRNVALAILLPGALGLGCLAWSDAPPFVARAVVASRPGRTGHDARYLRLQCALQLLQPRTAHQSRHPLRRLYGPGHRAVQQRRLRHQPQHRPDLHRKVARAPLPTLYQPRQGVPRPSYARAGSNAVRPSPVR